MRRVSFKVRYSTVPLDLSVLKVQAHCGRTFKLSSYPFFVKKVGRWSG